MFSKACEYAIKASVYIAGQSISKTLVTVKQVANATDAPEPFTAKILQQLCRANLLESVRGKMGGFHFNDEQLDSIKIYDIVDLIDGSKIFTSCGLGLKECSNANPCPVHEDFKIIRSKMLEMCQKFSLRDLALKSNQGFFFLKV
ncbi:MAG: Rrf2 family transcriptional regulator [Cruoricaptor ignavus]|nr:Rrf2 family transcriptional regulator [Cruoricaptor ignavus]